MEKNEQFLIVSIWRFDPVGGEYVSWPLSNEILPEINEPMRLKQFLLSCQHVNSKRDSLATIGDSLPDVWIPSKAVGKVDSEIALLLSLEIDSSLLQQMSVIQQACQFAKEVADAGVYIS